MKKTVINPQNYTVTDLKKNHAIIVLALEGCPAEGKTYTCQKFKEKDGMVIMNEGFIKHSNSKLNQQGIIEELFWLSKWGIRLEKTIRDNPNARIIITDRSPYTTARYVRYIRKDPKTGLKIIGDCGKEIKPDFDIFVKRMFKEFECNDVYIKTVYIKVDYKIWNKRRLERLKNEPIRKKYGEGDQKIMDAIRKSYINGPWTFTVENNTKDQAYNEIKEIINGIRMVGTDAFKEIIGSSKGKNGTRYFMGDKLMNVGSEWITININSKLEELKENHFKTLSNPDKDDVK